MSISKEIFGIKKEDINDCPRGMIDYALGYNDCANKIDEFELSEEELAKIILERSKDYAGFATAQHIAKAIKSNQSKLFVRKNNV